MPPSVIEQELWNIFTYYTLHADPTSPENFKVAHFVRFAKDCQIVSSRLSKAELTLELARVVRSKRSAGDDSSGQNICFLDFIALLEYLAPIVYPERAPELSIRRLLLENVFLLAGRRVPMDNSLKVDDLAANKLLQEKFGRSLQNIFNHYVDMANRRSIQDVVAEKVRSEAVQQRLDRQGLGRGTVAHDKMQEGKGGRLGMAKKQKQNKHSIGHKEFFQFSQDFKLKSSALLSAIVVGEIYLTAVPLTDTAGGGSGLDAEFYRFMDFERFLRSIMLMALVAYKDIKSEISPVDKVKALLLYMWRTINSREKTQQAVQSRYGTSKTVEGYANSLNIHGSGLFSVTMQDVWKEDGFRTYISSETDSQFEDVEANEALRRLSTFELSGSIIAKPLSPDGKGKQFILSASDVKRGPAVVGEDIVGLAGFENDVFPETLEEGAPEEEPSPEEEGGPEQLVLSSHQLAALFRKKPELAEFIFLELISMPAK